VNARVLQSAEVDYPVVSSLLADIVQAGGKRLRPLLLLLTARGFAYRENFEAIVTAAAGIELLHTASLIHDDTVDKSALRRGKPTLNSQLSTGAVILIGDYLFAQSAMLAAATNDTRAVAIFASTLGDLCDGQLMEMFYAQRLDQTREEYERRIYGKTASLFAGAAEMGAVLSRASEDNVQTLRQFGSDLGTAFQIVDDVLDVIGGTKELGKPAGHDLRQGTITLPVILYVNGLPENDSDRTLIEGVVSGQITDNAEIDALIGRIRQSGATARALDIADEFVARTRKALEAVPDLETRELLAELTDLIVHRSS
jgi:geranylgeranyl pyrophosphate synthase